ncbi:hypothetical protein Tco_0942389, partial [Tanacetum coccineum]
MEESTVKMVFGFIFKVIAYIFALLFGFVKSLSRYIVNSLGNGKTPHQFVNVPSPPEKNILHPCEEKLKQLEAMVAELSSKPSKIPQEKDEMLAESMNRIRSMEYDLQKTKKALFATASKQMELEESIETLRGDTIHPLPPSLSPSSAKLMIMALEEYGYQSRRGIRLIVARMISRNVEGFGIGATDGLDGTERGYQGWCLGEPLSLDRVFDFPVDEPEPHPAYDFFVPRSLPRYAANEPMVCPLVDEIDEPIVEAEKQVIAQVVDIDEDIAMLFGDDDFGDDDSEGFDEEEV